jgi:type IV secretory pathway protease TraF
MRENMRVNIYKSKVCKLLDRKWYAAFPVESDVSQDFKHLKELYLLKKDVDVSPDSQYLGIVSAEDFLDSMEKKGYHIFSI